MLDKENKLSLLSLTRKVLACLGMLIILIRLYLQSKLMPLTCPSSTFLNLSHQSDQTLAEQGFYGAAEATLLVSYMVSSKTLVCFLIVPLPFFLYKRVFIFFSWVYVMFGALCFERTILTLSCFTVIERFLRRMSIVSCIWSSA